jgi:hypothetical protein
LEPKHKFYSGGELYFDDKKYGRMIEGLRKRFWEIIYNGISFEEASKMDADDLLEAHAALRVINEEINKPPTILIDREIVIDTKTMNKTFNNRTGIPANLASCSLKARKKKP